jgi:hypothetical protein
LDGGSRGVLAVLTASTVLGTLSIVFPPAKVTGVLDQMAATGLVRPRAGELWTAHNAIVCLLASALPGEPAKTLPAVMQARDWRAVAPAAGRRLQLGVESPSIRDIRAVQVLIAEVMGRAASGWLISPIELIGHGLVFNPGEYAGAAPEHIRREYVSVPPWVISEFARHHGVARESEAKANAMLLGRISRSLRPEPEQEAAE